MKPISDIRQGLSRIAGALYDYPPHDGHGGVYTRNYLNSESSPTCNQLDLPTDEDESFSLNGSGSEFNPIFEIHDSLSGGAPSGTDSLSGYNPQVVNQSVRLSGMDALGWYVSFRHPGSTWGVHVTVSGIIYLIKEVFAGLQVPLETKVKLAFQAILNHELFHFATDYTVAQAELAHQESWYLPAVKEFRASALGHSIIEEQLANAYMLKSFKAMKLDLRVRGKSDALKAFTALQPKGYCDGWKVQGGHWDTLLEKLAHGYGCRGAKGSTHSLLWTEGLGYDWPSQFPIRPRIDWRQCPIHLVDDHDRIEVSEGLIHYFSKLGTIEESDKFRKALQTIDCRIQKAWNSTKDKLRATILPSADFKKWPNGGPNIYSVRVNDNFRAHLEKKDPDHWIALRIGSHKEMGHG